MKHRIPLSIVLSLMLGTTAFTSASGRTNSTMDPMIEWVDRSGENPFSIMGRWLAQDRDDRTRKWSHPAFRIRLGRRFSIKFPKR